MVLLLVAILVAACMVALLRPWRFFHTGEESRSLNERNLAAEFGKWVEKRASAHGLNVRGVARLVPVKCPERQHCKLPLPQLAPGCTAEHHTKSGGKT